MTLFVDVRQAMIFQEGSETVPTIRMGLVEPVPVALGVEANGVSVIFVDTGDRAMRNLVILR